MPEESRQPSQPSGDDTHVAGDITHILWNWDHLPDPNAALLPLVYEQLKAIAANRMNGERRDHTLQPTALVHEAYMKLAGMPESGFVFESRARFFGAAAEAMRRILIDHARHRKAMKQDARVAALDALNGDPPAFASLPDPDELMALNDALDKLNLEDPRAAEVVGLRYFAGLSTEETAEVMQLSVRTVHREWTFARARLHEMLENR